MENALPIAALILAVAVAAPLVVTALMSIASTIVALAAKASDRRKDARQVLTAQLLSLRAMMSPVSGLLVKLIRAWTQQQP